MLDASSTPTPFRHQDPSKDHCPNGHLWVYHSPGVGVLFEWIPSRAAECLDPMLGGCAGLLQSDGYGAYPACWAHARRKFVEASHPKAKKVAKHIAKLYRIETKLRENPDLDRAAHRRKHAPEHLKEIKTILKKEKPHTLPQSACGKAINYTLERWEPLNLYLEHGTLEIDPKRSADNFRRK